MSQFHPLLVTDIHHTIRDAVVLTLKPENPEAFAFTQGQYLTFKQDFDGTELRRNYSICAGLDDGELKVGIKRVDGGAFSTYANTELKVGDTLHAMPPQGKFFTAIEPEVAKNYLGFAGGSGITPVLSILKTVLKREPQSTFTLVYANRAVNTIMFREELEDLKNHYMGRLTIIHILESGQDMELFEGRIDQAKCDALFKHWIQINNIDTAFICGPEPMMLAIAEALKTNGL
ncbi:MAG TPA: phenylacetic acid degradation protein, partial [Sulfitobacter sp.]|nr:phenylacetic acid degradation protein [Sulfitobacter sp.]